MLRIKIWVKEKPVEFEWKQGEEWPPKLVEILESNVITEVSLYAMAPTLAKIRSSFRGIRVPTQPVDCFTWRGDDALCILDNPECLQVPKKEEKEEDDKEGAGRNRRSNKEDDWLDDPRKTR